MKLITLSNEQVQQYLNNAFSQIIEGLRLEEYLSMEQYNDIVLNYSVIVEDVAWIPKWLSKYLGLKDDSLGFRLVKAIGRAKHEGI